MFTGYFSRSRYDKCAYPDEVSESTSPYAYITNTNRIYNCNGCLTVYGPRSSLMGAGASNLVGNAVAASQENIDVDSIMSNRNVPISKCRRGKVNPVGLEKIKTVDLRVCNDDLDSIHSKMTDPPMFYRGAPINRFYDLNRDPQANIFCDWAKNTKLEARDNFVPEIPVLMKDHLYCGDDDWNPAVIVYAANREKKQKLCPLNENVETN